MKLSLPHILLFSRLLMAPVMLFLAWHYGRSMNIVLTVMLYLGLLSDIFDGILARKEGTSTPLFRRLDSQIDLIFWLSAGVCIWWLWPDTLRPRMTYVYALLGTEAMCYIVSWLRFGRETSCHAYLSKLWGITMLLAFTDLMWRGNAGFIFYLCFGVGIISQIERILITLVIPHWTHDIPTLYHAFLIRKGIPFRKNPWFHG